MTRQPASAGVRLAGEPARALRRPRLSRDDAAAARDGAEVIVNRGFVPERSKDRRPRAARRGDRGHRPHARERGAHWFTPADDPARGQWFTRDVEAIARAMGLDRTRRSRSTPTRAPARRRCPRAAKRSSPSQQPPVLCGHLVRHGGGAGGRVRRLRRRRGFARGETRRAGGSRRSAMEMVGARGIEPLTPSMSRKCSTAELSAQLHRAPSRGLATASGAGYRQSFRRCAMANSFLKQVGATARRWSPV